ncbi:XRE family transcriptional regulator [Rhodococcus sp. IEGM 1379]|uniref:XRE family transcriptional regulator n=1 Tax=Rhodococcus sp. IEGM 1379 TaxID=3047086 RepID=UPI0024B6A9CA|nr:XRE family transcriptional regulator [Rhodococcus sp. IEGM 1379]MDI9914405.1 XRE family transcriptional regulator [Rhodococcus sp. IEGM 1379]
MFLLSLDEVERVKRAHRISSVTRLAEVTALTRKTWYTALRDRRPTPQILDALARLGARPDRILISDEPAMTLSA